MCISGQKETPGRFMTNWANHNEFTSPTSPVVPFYPFLGEGSPTKIDYRKTKTEIGYPFLTSLLEDLVTRYCPLGIPCFTFLHGLGRKELTFGIPPSTHKIPYHFVPCGGEVGCRVGWWLDRPSKKRQRGGGFLSFI